MKTINNLFRNNLGFIAGIILFIVFLLVNPFQVNDKAAKVLAIAALMITWWVTEAMAMPVVALIPLVIFPLMNLAPIKEVSSSYADSIIFLFMGGFLIGLAIEKWGLHKRIALGIVNITGTSGNRIVLGFILATGLLSMWLSNTATTMMMYPIAASVITVIKANHKGNARLDNLAICIMLAIAYASNFGGIATIMGTPPNVSFVQYISEKYKYEIPFVDWMIICTPLALLLLFSLYFVMTKWLFPSHLKADIDTRSVIKTELHALGPIRRAEIRVLIVFCCTAFLWIVRGYIKIDGLKLDDTMIAMAGALTLFVVPSGSGKDGESKKLLEWTDTSRMAWGILMLFGGGIALATALEKAGLIKQLGEWIAGFSGSGGLMLVFMITLVSLFLSEVMSNIAQVIVFSPVIGGMADALHINPILLGLPMCLGASCASMMPMGTPPNAIVFASGYIKFNQMVKAGFVMNIIAVILITAFCWWLVPLLMSL